MVTGASQGIGKEYAFQVSHHQNGTLKLVALASFIVKDLISFCVILFFSVYKCTPKQFYTVFFVDLSLLYVFLRLHLCLPQLAQHGMNVVIISRSRTDLDVVAKEISKKKQLSYDLVTSHIRA